MDKQQFATLAIGIKSAYPASKILEDNASMDFWYMALKDIPYEIAENAVMEHICTNVFPPNIAEIRKLCMERCKPKILSFDEAWGVVQKAMADYGWYHPQEAFAIMDELTLSVVKNLGWSRLCQSENPTAERANFREAYMKSCGGTKYKFASGFRRTEQGITATTLCTGDRKERSAKDRK